MGSNCVHCLQWHGSMSPGRGILKAWLLHPFLLDLKALKQRLPVLWDSCSLPQKPRQAPGCHCPSWLWQPSSLACWCYLAPLLVASRAGRLDLRSVKCLRGCSCKFSCHSVGKWKWLDCSPSILLVHELAGISATSNSLVFCWKILKMLSNHSSSKWV